MPNLTTLLSTDIDELTPAELEKFITKLHTIRTPRRKATRKQKKEIIDMETLEILAAEFGVGVEEMKLALLKQGDVEVEAP